MIAIHDCLGNIIVDLYIFRGHGVQSTLQYLPMRVHKPGVY